MAYNWRQLTAAQRAAVLRIRHGSGQPWHGPPHGLEKHWYHLSAGCYEHAPIAGESPGRLAHLEAEIRRALTSICETVSVWCVLPNHYHALVQCRSLPQCRKALGRMHGRLSHEWNVEDDMKGRKCWHRCMPRGVRSEGHRWATVNYIHHNAVHHGYVKRWQDWPFCSAAAYLEDLGQAEARRIWQEYPILGMGGNWDPPDL